jgi:hypothetical protein
MKVATIGGSAIAVTRRLGMLDAPFDLVTAGGVFSSECTLLNDSLLETIRRQADGVRMIHWLAPPVVGALLLALDLLDLAVLPDTHLLAERVRQAAVESSPVCSCGESI